MAGRRSPVTDIRELLRRLQLGEPDRRIARDLDDRFARLEARRSGRARARVFCPIWRRPYMTINGDTYIHDMLKVCGARNIFADRPERYPTVTLDEVAARRPDVILLPDEPFRFRRAHLADFAKYTDVPAVRDGRIRLVDGKPFSWHGPRIAEALRRLPGLIDPAATAS